MIVVVEMVDPVAGEILDEQQLALTEHLGYEERVVSASENAGNGSRRKPALNAPAIAFEGQTD